MSAGGVTKELFVERDRTSTLSVVFLGLFLTAESWRVVNLALEQLTAKVVPVGLSVENVLVPHPVDNGSRR